MEIQPLPTSPYSTTTTTSSSTITTTTTINNNNNNNSNPPPATTCTTTTTTNTNNNNPMQMWWESISKARSRIHALSSLLPPHQPSSSSSISSLADTDRPALSLLSSKDAYSSVSSSLSSSPSSGSGHDPICQWLYDTLLSPDPDLRLFPLSLLPHLSSLYLSRLHSSPSSSSSPPPSFSGFEAVLLALYSSEVKSRAGKPVLVSVPDLSLPSLYHTPRPGTPNSPRPPPSTSSSSSSSSSAGVLCPPLEPQLAVKSTKRASVIAVTLDCYYRKISLMPSHSKLDFCRFASSWAGHHCPCRHDLDDPNIDNDNALSANSDEIVPEEEDGVAETDTTTSMMMTMNKLVITEGRDREVEEASDSSSTVACRVPLPWELMQPMLRILGHCLLGPSNTPEVRDTASEAVRALYARAMHEVVPQAILASRSLIRLDNSMRLAEKKAAEAAAAAAATSASNPNTPTKPRKPEILLMSK